jgi:ATP adenylyltransferase
MTRTCEACRLTNGDATLPGGRVFQTTHWVVEHCIGALGVGTLIVKPFRHTVHLSDLRAEETAELGPLLQRTAQVIQVLAAADQVYVCGGHTRVGSRSISISFCNPLGTR